MSVLELLVSGMLILLVVNFIAIALMNAKIESLIFKIDMLREEIRYIGRQVS